MKPFQRLAQQNDQPNLPHRKWTPFGGSKVLDKLSPYVRQSSNQAPRASLVIFLTVTSLTAALGHRFYNTPKLDVGKASPQTIYAPEAATIEDKKATEEQQKIARTSAISVLTIDKAVNQSVRDNIQKYIDQGNEFRQQAGSFPFVSTSVLSPQTQIYLRKVSDPDWQKILNTLKLESSANNQKARSSNPKAPHPTSSLDANQKLVVKTLLAVQHPSSQAGDYNTLIQSITNARQQYHVALAALSQQPPIDRDQGKPSTSVFDPSLLDLTDPVWQKAQSQLYQVSDRILAQGIAPGLPQSILQDAVNLQVKGSGTGAAEPIMVQILLASLQPNLVKDEEQTRIQAEAAAQLVKPQMVSVRQGEVIVRAGEEISTADFALLDYFKLSRRGVNWSGLIGFGIIVAGAVGTYWVVERRFQPNMRRRDRLLVWLLCLSTPLLVVLHVPSTNLPALGVLVGSFYGSPLGLAVTGLMTVLLATGMTMPWSHLLSSAASGIVCGWMAGRLRSREELALLGTGVGILQGVLYLVFNVASGIVWYNLLGVATIHALLGLAWCIVAIGSSPYLEQMFDLVTTIRLVELANPNRPLLKQLAAKTPGTFQHTLFVATLAEAAARVLGCDVELVRTGTLYHDIGKMHDPQGFIENQMGGPNKHDLINDPWKSADIIKKHVTEGLVMARKYRLPKAVQAFIPEHQGTMTIAYFYHQAQQRAQQVNEPEGPSIQVHDEDFRYDGPIPQSRETGIVMLADSCEAALRSLKDASYDEALAMINKILRARWQDQQLKDSGLTREDMTTIAKIFVEVWQQFNHQRIAYPKVGTLKSVNKEGQNPTVRK